MSRLLFEALDNLQTVSDRLRFQSQFPVEAVISTAFCRNLTAKSQDSKVSIGYILAGFCYRLLIIYLLLTEVQIL